MLEMNTQDLRVIKTQKAIKTVFWEMLKTCPIEKISVSALAREAQINKATFYLHYQDIYDLYNKMRDEFIEKMIGSMDFFPLLVTDPEEFLERYNASLEKSIDMVQVLWPTQDARSFPPKMTELCRRKIYGTCPIDPSPKADIVIDIILTCIMSLTFRYFHTEPELAKEVLTSLINSMLLPLCHTESQQVVPQT